MLQRVREVEVDAVPEVLERVEDPLPEELLRFGATDVSLEGILAGIKNEMQSALNAMLFDEIDTGLLFRSSEGGSFMYTEKPGEAVRQFGSIAKTDCETYKIWIDTARALVASGHNG